VAGFRKVAPDIEVTLTVLNQKALSSAFAEHKIQLAVLEHVPPGFNAVALRRHTLVAIVAPGRAEKGPPLTLLLREPGSNIRQAVEEWLATSVVSFASTMEFASNAALREGAAAGLGCAILSTDSIGFEVAASLVELIDLPGLPIHRTWHLVHPERRSLSPAAAALVSFARSPAGTEAIYA
jgi:DNA-binding transcriptional LysR family regulator